MTINPTTDFADIRQLAVRCLKDRVDSAETGQSITAPDDLAQRLSAFRVSPQPADDMLVAFANRLLLQDFELLSLALCLAADDDPHIARLVARAQEPVGGSRLLVGLLTTLFREFGATPLGLCNGNLVGFGIVAIGDERVALPERTCALAPGLAAALSGHLLPPPGILLFTGRSIALPDAYHRAVITATIWSAIETSTHLLVLRCPSEADGDAVVAALAKHMQRAPVSLPIDKISANAAWLTAATALPVVRINAAPGERINLPNFKPYQGLVILCTGFEGTIAGKHRFHEIQLSMPDEAERTALWLAHGADNATAKKAASAYRQGPARIADLAEQTQLSHKNSGSDPWHRLTKTVRTAKSELDGFARRSFAEVERSELILPDMALSELDLLVERIRQRNRLADTLGTGISRRYSPGVRALFNGESGTGKTLAAHWLSAQSGLPLYRVDQAVLTSKWIGETEKNLSAVLDAAQNADVLLFFDEADALFGARTDVSDANDRHANAQTNYLLQRIEDYEGVVIMATNSRERFDPAFVRRIDTILSFPMPDSAARLQLWKVHLGQGHDIGDQALGEIASNVELSGGHIRNIVLAAAVRANVQSRLIGLDDIGRATRDEYAKLGRPPPEFAR